MFYDHDQEAVKQFPEQKFAAVVSRIHVYRHCIEPTKVFRLTAVSGQLGYIRRRPESLGVCAVDCKVRVLF
jgi:hypothetical protein